jgi:hypothetical protein
MGKVGNDGTLHNSYASSIIMRARLSTACLKPKIIALLRRQSGKLLPQTTMKNMQFFCSTNHFSLRLK